MKKAIVLLMLLVTTYITFAGNANYSLNSIIQQKMDIKFNKFYLNLVKKYDLKEQIQKLINVNKKIDAIIPKLNNDLLITVLRYMEYKISKKIHQLQSKLYGQYGRTDLTIDNQSVLPKFYQKKLGIGIDVNWANFKKAVKLYKDKWPKDFKAIGFDNVRIRFNQNTDLSHLKRVVDDSLKAGLIPVVAFSAEEFKLNPNEITLEKAIQTWTKVAKILKNEPYKVSFDLIIEPGKNLKKKSEMLYEFYEKVVPAIRNTGGNNKSRIIFLAPNHLANPEYLKDLTPIFKKLDDKYLMAEFHFLAAGPFRKTNSTGKRLTWNGTGSYQERQKIENKLKIAVDWQNKTGIRVWFGAWMPGNYNHTYDDGNNNYSISEQIAFAKYFEGLLRKYNIPNDINADQQFYDIEKNTWRKDRFEVLKTIIETWKRK